jgi:hypothetical protein
LLISSYIRKPFLIYDFATAPLGISLNKRKIFFSFLSVYSMFSLSVLENITLEPVLFFVSFVGSMDSASVGQLLIDKTCNIDFNFTAGVCDNLLADGNEDANKKVQDEVAQFKVTEEGVQK